MTKAITGDVVRVAVFQPEFRDDLRHRVKTDRRAALQVLALIEAALRDPREVLGQTEPLRHLGSEIRSRRIAHEHHPAYLVTGERIDFLQARYDY